MELKSRYAKKYLSHITFYNGAGDQTQGPAILGKHSLPLHYNPSPPIIVLFDVIKVFLSFYYQVSKQSHFREK